jgi:7-cyano-7-deazaguanine synthase
MPGQVVLLSGGLDSSTLLYHQLGIGMGCIALSIYYGQRHSKELQAAAAIATAAGVKHIALNLPQLQVALGHNALTDHKADVPEGHYEAESMKATVVPNRNMILLSIAAGVAIAEGASGVCYAAHAGDHAIYPDCRPEFAHAMEKAFTLCNDPGIELRRPFIHFTKADIVVLGDAFNVPFHLTWSCYKGLAHHCGKCGTCVERKEAFRLAGVKDPTVYSKD